MIELRRGEFTPVSSIGKNPYKSGGDVLFYSYAPTDYQDQSLREEVVLAKLPGYPDQKIVGPFHSIPAIARAFNLLDSEYPSNSLHRQMNVIVGINFDTTNWQYCKWKGGLPFTLPLLDAFGILDSINETKYDRRVEPVGVIPDIANPLFTSPDYFRLSPIYDHEAVYLYWASVILHETAHVKQVRQNLPGYSLWSERGAISEQSVFLLKLLQSGRFRKGVNDTLVRILMSHSRTIQDYRNGKGFEGHIKETFFEGNPMSGQTLHNEDFAFGY